MGETVRLKVILLTVVLAIALAGGQGRQPSSGQQVQTADLICCMTFVKVPGDWRIARHDCENFMAIPEQRESICDQLRNKGVPCPSYCPPKKDQPPTPKPNKCEPPPPETNNPPWLNKDLPCRDWQQARISWSQTRASNMDLSFTIDICGEVIRYRYPGGGRPERMPPGSRSFDVCCDSWRNAANTGSPCDARLDIDCDGDLNDSDTMAEYSGRAREPDDFVTNSPLGGLPFGKDLYKFMPGASGCKDCKWELVRVEYECKNVAAPIRSANRPGMAFDATYKYKATWKCPSNGQTRETNDVATMYDQRCPDPSNASWP